MSLIKIPFLVVDGACMHFCATPPNRPTPPDEHLIPDWREKFLKSLGKPCVFLRFLYYITLTLEIMSILTHNFSKFVSHSHIFHAAIGGTCASRLGTTPIFLLGMFFVIGGTFLRLDSFRALGKFFTFELHLFKDHELVVDGPYAYVRHPSYTGLIMTIVGICCNRLVGSWAWECGMLQTITGKILALIWFSIAMCVIASLLLRIPREEAILHDQFREQWVQWTERVPYKLVPGVF